MPKIRAADGTELYVKTWGQGRPVVLIHGWPLSADSWDDQALALADNGFRAIAYDRRGFGRSDQPFDGYDYYTLADGLAAEMEQTGARDAALVGFSMGGGEVARYMSRHAGRSVVQAAQVSSVVPFMLRTHDNPNGVPQALFDEMAQGMRADQAQFFSGFFKDFFGQGLLSHPVSDARLQWCRQVALQAGLKPTLACAKAFASTDFRPDLKAFHAPTLVVYGSDAMTLPIDAAGRAAAAAIAQAQLHVKDGAPHGLFATHGERLTQNLLTFLRG